jgi:Flp pilus assembly protein TadG
MATLKQSLLRRLAKSESGAELIEFALTLPLLLLLVLGIIEFGFMFQEYEVLTNAAREGARIAVLPTYGATDTARKNNAAARIDEYLTDGGLNKSLATKCIGTGCAGTAVATSLAAPASGCVSTITVTVTYPHQMAFIGGIARYFGGSFGTKTLTATSMMRTEAAAATCP